MFDLHAPHFEQQVDVPGGQLFCRVYGEGSPLVVVHGGPGLSQDYLLPALSKLAEGRRVIFYDQRGCGLSTGEISPETINLDVFIRDLDAIRQAFHYEKVSLLAHSWGAFLGLNYATRYPERIDRLIISNAFAISSAELEGFISEWSRRMAPFAGELDAIHKDPGYSKGEPALMQRLHRTIFATYCYDPQKASLLNLHLPAEASINGSKVYQLIRQSVFVKPFDLQEDLRRLKMPTLIIHGEADVISPSNATTLHQCIEGSRYVSMKRCGHFPHVEDPDVYFKTLTAFLSEKNG